MFEEVTFFDPVPALPYLAAPRTVACDRRPLLLLVMPGHRAGYPYDGCREVRPYGSPGRCPVMTNKGKNPRLLTSYELAFTSEKN